MMTTNRHSDPREQAEAVARWCGWRKVPATIFGVMAPWNDPRTGKQFGALPPYADSLDAMREVEDEIERRGLLEQYRLHLHAAWCKDRKYPAFSLFLITLTALQRLEAAAKVIEEVSHAD